MAGIRLDGTLVWRGERDYERARQRLLWNEWKPNRFPEVIATVASELDIAEAVKLARSRRLKVAIRGGGHSFCGSPVRDGGMLIDLGQLREISIDADSRTATVQPAVTARELAAHLAHHGLGFPVGHCGSVAMSGYLLAGGLGWNMGAWGPACFSVHQVDAVTADGEFVTANEQQNPELLWAARGAGPGFFAVATRFHLRVYPLPKVVRSTTQLYPLSELEDITAWASEIAPTLPSATEMLMLLASAPPGAGAPPGAKIVGITAAAFADSEQHAASCLSPLDSCPALDRALWLQTNEPTSIEGLQEVIGTLLPERHRYASDNVWSNEDLTELLPRVAEHVASAPSAKSVVFAAIVPPPPPAAAMPDAAFSMVAKTLLLHYAIWDDPADDQRNRRWLQDAITAVEPFAVGHNVAEADLAIDPSRSIRSFAPTHWERLQTLKATYDPSDLFHSFLGLGDQPAQQQPRSHRGGHESTADHRRR